MKYNSRKEVEDIGKIGAYFEEIEIEGKPSLLTRQMSSYYLCCKNEDRGISIHHKEDGFWEAWITLWMSRNVKPESRCIDGGANYGFFTFLLEKAGCKVIAIEANPEIIPYLNKSVELNGCSDRVVVLNRAISERSDDLLLLNVLTSSLNTTIVNRHDSGPIMGSIVAKTVALDDFEKIDFIKLDIEGAEELAWKGMQNLLKRNPQCVVMLEFVYAHYEGRGLYFYQSMLKDYDLTYVNYQGNEEPFIEEMIQKDTEDFRMIVLRRKQNI